MPLPPGEGPEGDEEEELGGWLDGEWEEGEGEEGGEEGVGGGERTSSSRR